MNSNNTAINSAKELIKAGKATCVVIKDGRIISTEYASGIKPVLSMYDAGLLDGAVLVDKVIGRATAMIAVHGGAIACLGVTMSQGAYDFLTEHSIRTEYEKLAPHIINRQGTDMCPMEKAVWGLDDTELAIIAIRKKLKELAEEK